MADRPEFALNGGRDVVEGDVDRFPDTLLRLFQGGNTGKLVLAIER